MRQESTSLFDSQDHPSKKQHIHQKRNIRKHKLALPLSTHPVDLYSIDTSKLSKEERAKLQKAKNREAAQKSRDQHKEYVEELEHELKQLKENQKQGELICSKCKREIESMESENADHSRGLQITTSQQPIEHNFNNQSFNHYSDFEASYEQESLPFVRQSSQEDNSILKMIFFIAMVAVAVFFMNSSISTNLNQNLEASMTVTPITPRLLNSLSKDLMEIKENDENKSIPSSSVNKSDKINGTANGVVPVNRQLVPLDDLDCLHSLMKMDTGNVHEMHLYNGLHNMRRLRLENTAVTSTQNNLLFCHLKMPETYYPAQEQQTSLIKLILVGSEVKELLKRSHDVHRLWEKNILSDGLYKVDAEIKGVKLVNDPNCLL